MRDLLAERLLAKVMKWNREAVTRERPILEALATFKYDEYQQFVPGMRFIESLALWLGQFELDEERNIAYAFIRSRLIFISRNELNHLITVVYPDFIRPLLIKKTATSTGLSKTRIMKIADSNELKLLLRQSLFLGLSDGARIDVFRRNTSVINHEQVWPIYQIPPEKVADMLSNLSTDLKKLLGKKPTDKENKFRMLFLLDDFSGSGISYLRQTEHSKSYKGKISKVMEAVDSGSLSELVDSENLHICVILYVASEKAVSHLEKMFRAWRKNKFDVIPIQMIPASTSLLGTESAELMSLFEKYFDDRVVDEHFRIGKHERPYLGFDECALPLVLEHNTPNNSVPLLWHENDDGCRALFPRISRHGREV